MTDLHHTLSALEKHIAEAKPHAHRTLAGLCWDLASERREQFKSHWLSTPSKLLAEIDPSVHKYIDKELSTLSWFPEQGSWHIERSRKRMPITLPFDFAWMHITFEKGEMSSIPHGTLRDVRSVLLQVLTPEGASLKERERRDDDFVLMVAVDGPGYRVPDLAVIGPSQRTSNGDSTPEMVKTVFVDLNRTVQDAGFHEQYVQEKLGSLRKLGHPERWRETFETSLNSRDKIRKQFSIRLRTRMEALMNALASTVEAHPDALDAAAFEDVDDTTRMKAAREAATLLVFRLMFLSELESRRLLYQGNSPANDAILTEYAADIGAARSNGHSNGHSTERDMLRRLVHLTRAVRIGDPVVDDDVVLSGGSLFDNRPSAAFSPLPGVWLDALEQVLDKGDPGSTLRTEWNDALAQTCELVTGFVDDEVQLARTRAGSGGAEHTHRIFGDVYEQLLRYTPERTDDGRIALTIDEEERKKVAAHYTPAPLVEEVVRPTLGRLFEQHWDAAEGDPDAYIQRLCTTTIVDPAMGSAHFLTVGALELAREIAYARLNGVPRPAEWHRPLEHANPIGPDPDDASTLRVVAPTYAPDAIGSQADFDRHVAEVLPMLVQRCVYGVDVKPVACELGKLALWLFTMAVQEDASAPGETPSRSLADDLVYLNANIRSGDSLVGLWLDDVEATIKASVRSENSFSGRKATLFGVEDQTETLADKLAQARRYLDALRHGPKHLQKDDQKALEAALGEPLFPNPQASTYEKKGRIDRAVRTALQDLQWVFDLTLAIRYTGYTSRSRSGRAKRLHAVLFGHEPTSGETSDIKPAIEGAFKTLFDTPDSAEARDIQQHIAAWIDAKDDLNRLHWQLAFPGIFARGGFDAVLANPPFIGDKNLNGHLESADLVDVLANTFIPQQKKSEYAGFFFWRYHQILNAATGVAGSLATNSIAQASNRAYVTKPLTTADKSGHPPFHLFRALPNRPWPGEANVHCAALYLSRQGPDSAHIVRPDFSRPNHPDRPFAVAHDYGISSYLDEYPDFDLRKLISAEATDFVFTGMFLRGNFSAHRQPGDSLADAVAAVPEAERDALAAYLNADDVQQNPRATPSDVVIDFFGPLKRAGLQNDPPQAQRDWLEANYPHLFQQLQTRSPHAPEKESVHETRTRLSHSTDNTPDKRFWWLFGRPRRKMRRAWHDVDDVVAFPRVIKVWTPFRLPKHIQIPGHDEALRICPMDKIYSAPTFGNEHFAITASFLFEMLVRRQCGTLKSDLNFSPTDVFPYFPWPWEPTLDGHRLRIGTPPAGMKAQLTAAAKPLLDLRTSLLETPQQHGLTRQQVGGPTDLYNLYDSNPASDNAREGADAPAIERLRQAHVNLLNAVLRAYGWDDLADTLDREAWTFARPWLDRTERFAPPEPIRAELFNRIDRLNRRRHAQEQAMLTDFIVEHLPAEGVTKTKFTDTEPFQALPIDGDRFEALMEAEQEKMGASRVKKDGHRWKSLR